jgi:hypothetical protein
VGAANRLKRTRVSELGERKGGAAPHAVISVPKKLDQRRGSCLVTDIAEGDCRVLSGANIVCLKLRDQALNAPSVSQLTQASYRPKPGGAIVIIEQRA